MNQNTTPNVNQSSDWVQNNPDLSPRENVLDYIHSRLNEAVLHDDNAGIFDSWQVAIEVLEFVEEHAKARMPSGELAFVNADHPIQFLESK